MEELRERIKKDGIVLNDRILKVDSFLNHQCDPILIMKIGEAIAKRFGDEKPTKVLTIEASGIHVAFATALVLRIPFVFAKKKPASTQQGSGVYTVEVESFTRGVVSQVSVSKEYILSTDRVLIVDDFLATGNAAIGLANIIEQAGATLVGTAIVVEKSFQTGRKRLEDRNQMVWSLARVSSMSPEKGVVFVDETN
eukprot:TRINITY_DN9421_c0_g1_i1.p1 TRINITY_DN9421_c0_g1~~TRINITY_DN9421_c0_g1_i1.p1  ORF type:complete len:196 (+),score=75.71 TRINITY_DN9421_c0_g1_i1:226-813(+)